MEQNVDLPDPDGPTRAMDPARFDRQGRVVEGDRGLASHP